MSLARYFAYLFISSKKVTSFGLLPRIIMCTSIVVTSLAMFILGIPLQILGIYTTIILALEFLVLWIGGGLRRVLSGFMLVLLFTIFGFVITLTSMLMRFTPPAVEYMVSSMFRMVALVLSFATMLQFLTVEEIRWMLVKIGLEEASVILALTFSQLPLTLMYFSEALTTIKLKLGKKKIYKVVKPLIVYSVINSLNVAEALYIHGVYPPRTPKIFNGLKDLLLIVISVTIIATILIQCRLL
ncbi:MAG: hypothetical protein QW775_07615 [Ignisphaera sp.]|uniref:Energy-coupling factor transporter transmembrane protein EcfT n=1 Tax=Ignisphaera aggregans TaxID=334771 RepID=A0A7C4JL85_9CREN